MGCLIFACCAIACSSGGSSGGGPVSDPDVGASESILLTDQAVQTLLLGVDDFAGISELLKIALESDPGNTDARLFKGIVDFLHYLQQTAWPVDGPLGKGGSGRYYDLFTRSGYENLYLDDTFWAFELEAIEHQEGTVYDSFPSLEEWRLFLDEELLPEIQSLAIVLNSLPGDYTYERITRDGTDAWVVGDPDNTAHVYEIDSGDILFVQSVLQGVSAAIEGINAYDWRGYSPNDFDPEDPPGLDPWADLQADFPDFLKLIDAGALLTARDMLVQAFDDYQVAATYLFAGENPIEEELLLNLAQGAFDDPQELVDLVEIEPFFQTWMEETVAVFFVDTGKTFYTWPNGTPLEPEQQPTINLFKFWNGVDLGDLLIKTVVDPLSKLTVPGVRKLADLNAEMSTVGGVLEAMNGRTPNAGDLQETVGIFPLSYAVRIGSPPEDTKIIDGFYGDWSSKRVQIAATPAASFPEDLGGLYLAVDADHLYLHLDTDVIAYAFSYWGNVFIQIRDHRSDAAVELSYFSEAGFSAKPFDLEWVSNSAGLELAAPLDQLEGGWVEIQLGVVTDNPEYEITSLRSRMFARIR